VDRGSISRIFHQCEIGRKLTLCSISEQAMNIFYGVVENGLRTNVLDFGFDPIQKPDHGFQNQDSEIFG